MGFLPRLFSLSLRGGKKKKQKEQERLAQAQAQAQREAQSLRPTTSALNRRTTLTEHELLRMSSRNCSVYGEIDYLSPNSNAPPLAHPVNEFARSRASSRASSHLERASSYVVRVHGPPARVHSRTTSTTSSMAPPPLPATTTTRNARPTTPPTSCSNPSTQPATPSTPPTSSSAGFPLSPEDARQLARLRSDVSVADLVTLYTGEAALDREFRNSPRKLRTPGLKRTHNHRSEDLDAYGRGEGREQLKRKSTDLRSLLHASPLKSDEGDDSGDVLAWADDVINQTMFLAEGTQDADPEPDTSASFPPPRPSFSSEGSNDHELYFSSTVAEVGSAASHANTNCYPSPSDFGKVEGKQQLQRSGSVRASEVFGFLLRKDDPEESFVVVGDKSTVGSLRRTRSAGSAAVLSGAGFPAASTANANLYRSSTTAVDTPSQTATAPLRLSTSRPARPTTTDDNPFWTNADTATMRPRPISHSGGRALDSRAQLGGRALDFGVDSKPLPAPQPEPVKRKRSQSGGRVLDLEPARALSQTRGYGNSALAARSTSALTSQPRALPPAPAPAARGRRTVGGPREMRPPSRSPMRSAPLAVEEQEQDDEPPAVPEKPTISAPSPSPSPGWHQPGVVWARAGEVLGSHNSGVGRRPSKSQGWSAADLGYEEVKENLPLHHTPSTPLKFAPSTPLQMQMKPWLGGGGGGGLEAPSPAPSRASSSELSPVAQRIMQDARQKRVSRSGVPGAWR